MKAIDRQSKSFFLGGKFTWEKTELDVWNELELVILKHPVKGPSIIHFNTRALAFAASLLILVGLGSFFRFYTTQVTTSAGYHQLANLPDGSTVELNAESTLKYHPYWWRFNRQLSFEGEGLFKVEKGKKFAVVSSNGTTEVLGTSFNIFSRNEVYKVTCLTGSVKVISKIKEEVVLKPNSKAEIQTNGKIKVIQNIDPFPEISWEKNIFLFTATPIMEVFYEIERQYGVTISAKIDTYSLYSGNFTRKHNIEEVLSFVCPALGLKYSKKSEKQFLVTQESE